MGKMDRFLALYPNDNTFRNYRAGLMSFADWKYGPQRKGREATKEELTRYDQLLDEYMASGPDHIQDFMEYSASLSHQNTPPHTARVRFIIWKEFLAEQGIEIRTRDLKRIRTKLLAYHHFKVMWYFIVNLLFWPSFYPRHHYCNF